VPASPPEGRTSNKSLLVSGGEHRETILYPIPIDTSSSPTYIIWPLGGVLFKALAMDLTAILFLKAAPLTIFFQRCFLLYWLNGLIRSMPLVSTHSMYHMAPCPVTFWLFVIFPPFHH
jgi:hypothetical protein